MTASKDHRDTASPAATSTFSARNGRPARGIQAKCGLSANLSHLMWIFGRSLSHPGAATAGLWITSAASCAFRGTMPACESKIFCPSRWRRLPFTFGSAVTSGVTLDRLRRKDVVNVGRGLYRPARDWLEGAARALSAASPEPGSRTSPRPGFGASCCLLAGRFHGASPEQAAVTAVGPPEGRGRPYRADAGASSNWWTASS